MGNLRKYGEKAPTDVTNYYAYLNILDEVKSDVDLPSIDTSGVPLKQKEKRL